MSHPLARPLVRELRNEFQRAFTLIELLTVIAIIGILVAITLGISNGVRTRAAMGQARSELAVISQSLESYKRQYGDYPQTGSTQSDLVVGSGPGLTSAEAGLFNALTGKLGPTLQGMSGKNFLELAKFTLEKPYDETKQDNALLDPWGNRYHYYYNSVGATKWSNYILYSMGPDAKDSPPDKTKLGLIDTTPAENADNIYANKN